MIGMRIVIEEDFKLIAESVGRWVSSGFSRSVEAMVSEAKSIAPVKTGRLRDSISSHKAGPLSAAIGAGAKHAGYVYGGTGVFGPGGRQFEIIPRNKRALYWRGARHPVKKVVQSGIRPREFISDSAIEAAILKGFAEDTGEI